MLQVCQPILPTLCLAMGHNNVEELLYCETIFSYPIIARYFILIAHCSFLTFYTAIIITVTVLLNKTKKKLRGILLLAIMLCTYTDLCFIKMITWECFHPELLYYDLHRRT